MNFRTTAGALAMAALLAGCGGGGGDDAPEGTGTSAEGFWAGSTSDGYDVALMVLDNGDTWGLFLKDRAFHGVIQGVTNSSDGSLNGSGRAFDFMRGTVTASRYSGSYASGRSMALGFEGGSFSGTYSDEYDQPASLAALAGNYAGAGVLTSASGGMMSIQVTAAGAVSTPPSNDCTASGTVAPRPGGKNVFDLRMTFSGPRCLLGNGATVSGLAIYEDGMVIAMGVKPSADAVFVFLGEK